MMMHRRYQPCFNDRHNAVRSKSFLVLYARRFVHNNESGLSASNLARLTGERIGTIQARLGKWTEWGFVLRSPAAEDGRLCWTYRLADRGRKFVEGKIPIDWRKRYTSQILASRK